MDDDAPYTDELYKQFNTKSAKFSLTLFSEITIIGRGSCQRNPGMETFNAFKGSKMGFLFVEFVYFFVKETQASFI